MSTARPPSNGAKFSIRCNLTGDNSATAPTNFSSNQCTVSAIDFVDGGSYGGAFDLWTWQQVPGTSGFGFKNVATQAWIAPRDSKVVTCLVPDATCVWEIYDQGQGSSYVRVPAADIIWQIKTGGELGMGSARTAVTDDKRFSFWPASGYY